MCVGVILIRLAVIGVGSMGSALADMAARACMQLILVDPDDLDESNLKRHVLRKEHLGQNKAVALSKILGCTGIPGKFSGLPEVDIIACCADSDLCRQMVNAYALENKIPCVFGSVHGAAETAEIITVIPGLTPCYACYERELPAPEDSTEKYTNPSWDSTKTPHMPGLWSDILMAAAIQYRAILSVPEGSGGGIQLVSLRPPYGSESFQQEGGCAVCAENFASLSV